MMGIFSRPLAVLGVVFALMTAGVFSAWSQALDAQQQADMQARVDSFQAIISKGDMAAVFDYMPPKILELIATQSGVSIDQIKAAAKTEIEEALKTVTFDSFTMDTKAGVAGKLENGLVYMLIPTETKMSVDGAGKVRATSETLALNDGGKWYLVRIDTPTQSDLVKKIYPGFASVEFKPGTMETIEQ
jgi:hypothetical protein